jgi:ATP synthase F0 subunit c
MRPSRPLARSSAVALPLPAVRSAPAVGDGLAGASYIQGVARQPEAQGRLQTIFFLTVGLVEAMFFINLAFMALFVFVLGK